MIALRPIKHRDAYTIAVEAKLRDYFAEVVYGPLAAILEDARVPDAERVNSISGNLRAALESGRVWYADGAFFGRFSAAISRELREMGATYDARDGTFRIAVGDLPIDVQTTVAGSIDRARAAHTRVDEFLDLAAANVPNAPTGIDLAKTLAAIEEDLIDQFAGSVDAVTAIEVPAGWTPTVTKIVEEEFTQNLDRYVKDFLAEEIPVLRALVQANATAGYRTDRLVDLIAARHGVARRKAAFLADQETSLFVSKFREARYREIGVRQYRWSTSHDDRVRLDHRLLDGTVHSWDSPPVTNRKTGARNHPGEDFRCRCVPIAILEIAERGNARSEFRCRAA